MERWSKVTSGFYRKGSGRQAPRLIRNEEGRWELYRNETAIVEVFPTARAAIAAELSRQR